MYRLKRYNVIKEVNSKHGADKLVREGFTLASQPVFAKAVEPVAKPSEGNKKKKKVKE